MLYAGLFGVFHCNDDLFNVSVGDELFDVVHGAETGHYRGETAFGVGGAVNRNETHKGVTGIGLLVFQIKVGLVCFAVAANEQGGESDLAVMHFAHDGGCLHKAAGVGEGEVDEKQEEE